MVLHQCGLPGELCKLGQQAPYQPSGGDWQPKQPLRFGQEVAPEGPTLPSVCSQPQPEVPWVALAEGGHQGRRQAQPADSTIPLHGGQEPAKASFVQHGHPTAMGMLAHPSLADAMDHGMSHALFLCTSHVVNHTMRRGIAIAPFQELPCSQLADDTGIDFSGLRFVQLLPPPTPFASV